MARRYSSISDVIACEIVPALGELAGDYDVEAIAREAFEGVADGSGYHLTQRDGVDFWEIVAKHDTTSRAE